MQKEFPEAEVFEIKKVELKTMVATGTSLMEVLSIVLLTGLVHKI